MRPDYTPKQIENFWKKVDKSGGSDACWEWTGARHPNGYGIFGIRIRSGTKNFQAHRFSWEVTCGPIPNGLLVLHQCDNPACVNPGHLSLGTQTDNMRERYQRTGYRRPKVRKAKKHIPWNKRIPGTPEHFWSKVAKSGNPDDCWNWIAGCDGHGYGAYTVEGKNQVASRLAFELTYGEIPDGLIVCHHCDNPPCCNPNHLFLGTAFDNFDDRRRKGKGNAGERNGRCKLSDKQVAEIRHRYAKGEKPSQLAREYGVDRHTITNIGRGRRRA